MWSIFKNKKIATESNRIVFDTRPKLSGKKEIQKIEVDLFLEAIFQRYGYDFRDYSKASIRRKLNNLLLQSNKNNISELIYRLLYDENYFRLVVNELSSTMTEMFRDPLFYKNLRERVLPGLRMLPSVRIWVVGCSLGEEVFSLAILLKEAGIYNKTTIYATDLSDDTLIKAKQGIYPLKKIQAYTSNYQQSGGIESFSDYYYAQYDSVIIEKSLKERVHFVKCNPISSNDFKDMNLIFCRNVLIYFNTKLQNRVLHAFKESLCDKGYLCLGNKETIERSSLVTSFENIVDNFSIFQKKNL